MTKFNEIKKRIPKDISKHTDRDISIFSSHIFGEVYTKTIKEKLNFVFSMTFWSVKDRNTVTFYRSEKEHVKFRKYIGEMAMDEKHAKTLVLKLKYYTDWITRFIKENPKKDDFLKKKKEFADKYRNFFFHHQVVYWSSDYLHEKYPELDHITKALDKIYDYNQMVVPNVETYLRDIDVDKILHNQDEPCPENVGIITITDYKDFTLIGTAHKVVEEHIQRLGEKDYSEINSVKGDTIFPSKKITGEILVIDDLKKQKDVKPNTILVTTMTRPNFNNILSKCKAIITDDGNTLSHAAILAREFEVPTIVGTKIASKVFKTGDRVEIDFEKGLISRIN